MRVHRRLRLMFTWTTFLILFEPYHDLTESCFYESIHLGSMLDTSAVKPSQVGSLHHRRLKKSTQEVYRPLRITTVYSLKHLSVDEQNILKWVLERAVRKMTSLLSVHQVDGLLLLPRSACPVVFREGINKGKCVRIQNGYTGEYCMDRFKIPPTHLEGFEIYNSTDPEPVKIYWKRGPGLRDTDFVLYVTSQMTDLCDPFKTSALAYAAYCKLDHTARPIAGQVNFCPRTVKDQKFDEELLYKTAVHELFHALGFSNKLFDKFRKCNEAGVCEPWPQPMVKPVDGTMRLVTGAVVREMRKHFNCSSEPDFGGPLEVEGGKVTSHWDTLIMHSSIMGSMEQKPYQTLIDPISLAVFEDSGWYKVNYSQADKFIWGQGQGCSFGLPNVCGQHNSFCLQNITGCHYMRLSKARCNVNTKVPSRCRVFAADQKPCFMTPLNSTSLEDESFSLSSRCFLSSLRPASFISSEKNSSFLELMGKCYERRCEGDKYYLRVKGGDWLLCLPESYIQVEGFEGSVLCASYELVCSDFIHPEPPFEISSSTPAGISETSQLNTQDSTTSWKQPNTTVVTYSEEKETSSSKSFFNPVTLIIGLVVIIYNDLLS